MWYGRYREDEIRDGHTVRVRRNTPLGTKKEYPTKRLAERRMEQLLSKINDPGYRPGRVAVLADFAERWKAEVLSIRKRSTQGKAKTHLCRYIIPHLGKMRLDALGIESQQAFITNLKAAGVPGGYVVDILTTLAVLLRTAKKWGYICQTVNWRDLTLPDDRYGKGRSFTAEQGKQIIAEAGMPFRLMFALAAYCGLRAGEIMGLRAEDIDLERRTLRVTQTAWRGSIQTAKTRGSETSLPLPDSLCGLLRAEMLSSGLLFINRRGRPYTAARVVKKQLHPILDRLGIPRAGFHAFRHMHTTMLVDSGASIKTAQRQLRHASASTTLDVYAHVVEPSHRKAVEEVAKYLN
jgi:integrase